jgi:hypothetical protein
MLNIISRSIYQLNPAGPKKVVQNLIRGLRLNKTPFVVNKKPMCTDLTLIHDDLSALAYIQKRYTSGSISSSDFELHRVLLGPNLTFNPSTLEAAIPGIMTKENSVLQYCTFICPSLWVETFWRTQGFATKIAVWPVGVDTYTFDPVLQKQHLEKRKSVSAANLHRDILIYTKGRSQEDIYSVIQILDAQGLTYTTLQYGEYNEQELIDAALTHALCISVISSESQGLAIQELLALNIPILVWNISYLNQKSVLNLQHPEQKSTTEKHDPATSVPYFDERCGVIVDHVSDILPTVIHMLHNRNQFTPRSYILENMSLEKQAQALLHIGDTYTKENSGTNNPTSSQKYHMKNWRNRTWLYPWLVTKYIIKFLYWKLRQ